MACARCDFYLRVGVQRLGQLADLQPLDGGDPFGGERAIPARRLNAIGVLGLQPAIGLDQRAVGMPAACRRLLSASVEVSYHPVHASNTGARSRTRDR